LRDLPLIGLARENYPDYRAIRAGLLKRWDHTRGSFALINDGIPRYSPPWMPTGERVQATVPGGLNGAGQRGRFPRAGGRNRPARPARRAPQPHAETFAALLRAEVDRLK